MAPPPPCCFLDESLNSALRRLTAELGVRAVGVTSPLSRHSGSLPTLLLPALLEALVRRSDDADVSRALLPARSMNAVKPRGVLEPCTGVMLWRRALNPLALLAALVFANLNLCCGVTRAAGASSISCPRGISPDHPPLPGPASGRSKARRRGLTGIDLPLPVENNESARFAAPGVFGATATLSPFPVVNRDSARFARPGVLGGTGTVFPLPVLKSDSEMFAAPGVLGGTGTVFPLPVVNSDSAMFVAPGVLGGTGTVLPLPVVNNDSAMSVAPGVLGGIGTVFPLPVVKSESAMFAVPGALGGIGTVFPFPVVNNDSARLL